MNGKRLAFLAFSLLVMLTLVTAALFGEPTEKSSLFRYLSVFTEVFSLVRNNYVDAVPANQLVDGAFSGVTNAVDEYSYYIPPAQMAAYNKFKDDEPSGLGLVVTKRFGYAYVISVLQSSPAEIAGVRPGDFVEFVNGKPTQKLPIWQIRSILQESPGKTVDLRLLHGGMSKRRDVTVQRGRYDAPDPTMREYGDVAYVRIPYFEDGTAAKFASVVAKAGASGKKKLIVDVRDNAGGSLDEAIAAADSLLSKGLITTLSGRRVEPQQWQADAETVYDGEVQVLVDGSSAGTAEIFAAAISGNKRGKATGLPTFGYAVSQKLVPLTSGGALYVTVGHFTTPDRKPITEQGFRPDNMVDMTPLAVKKEEEQERARDEYILQEALELFGQKQAKTAA
jgi:carboxyl-terminal processing protease